MGYPTKLLSGDEVIEAEFRPHWSRLLKECLILLAAIALAILTAVLEWPVWLYGLFAVGVIVLTLGGFVRWLTTLHVITNERIVFRAGFIAKSGTEIPLEVINDVAFSQTMFERIFGTGDLMIESAGTHGQTRYSDIPRPEEIQTLIYRVRETRMASMKGGHPAPPASTGRVEDLATLARLHDEGKLNDAEYEAEKKRILET